MATPLKYSSSDSYVSDALLNHLDPRKESAFELPEGQCDWHQVQYKYVFCQSFGIVCSEKPVLINAT